MRAQRKVQARKPRSRGLMASLVEGRATSAATIGDGSCPPRCENVVDGDDDGPTDGSCSICLEPIALPNMAIVKGCEHTYCVFCILEWASMKEPHTCPQCKQEFSMLYCLRKLDGTVLDDMQEESVCMLQRALWAQRRAKPRCGLEDADPALSEPVRLPEEACDFYTNDIDDTEDYYFSNAAGHARIILGNRRFGKNGYVRAGHVYAQPAASGNGSGKMKKQSTTSHSPAATEQPALGRRARRKAKRAAHDSGET